MHVLTKYVWMPIVVVALYGAIGTAIFARAQAENIVATTTESAGTSSTAVAIAPASWYTSDFISGGEIAVGDFVVGPGKLEVTVKPGETVTKMMTVTNRIANNKTFELSVEDMSGSVDPSIPVVLLGDKNGPYTLRDNVSFPKNIFTLALGERAQIPVTITMPPNAEPGGYYGSVLVSTVQKGDGEDGASASSPIIARVGTLLFITVPGAAQKSGVVTEFSTVPNKLFFTKGPLNLGVLFENTGSVHLNPYGDIKVTNILGEEVGFIEIEPWFVLPKSLRLREIVWDRELLLGRYTITASINRGYDDVVDIKTIHIWVLPWQFLASVFAGVFVLFVLVKLFLSRFELKRK